MEEMKEIGRILTDVSIGATVASLSGALESERGVGRRWRGVRTANSHMQLGAMMMKGREHDLRVSHSAPHAQLATGG